MTLTPVPVDDARFAPYGHVARPPASPPLARTDRFAYWSDAAHYRVEGETEIGYCTVYRAGGNEVGWMERHHHTPELLIPADAPFVLPVMDAGGRVEAFRVAPGEAVVIGPGVWHSACLPADGEAATYFVLFRRGTPHEDVEKRDIPVVTLSLLP